MMSTEKQRALTAIDRVMLLSFAKNVPHKVRKHCTDREWEKFCEGRELALTAVQDIVREVMVGQLITEGEGT